MEAIVTIQKIIKEAIVKATNIRGIIQLFSIREPISNKALTREEEMKYSRIISTSNTAEGYNS